MARLKPIVALAVAAAVWLTANLGQTWWVLLVLLCLDALFNYRQEREFWGKVGMQFLALAAATYMQNGASLDAVRLVLVGMVAWEVTRVDEDFMNWLAALRARNAITPAEQGAAQAAIDELRQKVAALEQKAS